MTDDIARMLQATLLSDKEDCTLPDQNVVDGLFAIAHALRDLTSAVESLSIRESDGHQIERGLLQVADAIDRHRE